MNKIRLKKYKKFVLNAKLGNRINKFNQYVQKKKSVSNTATPEDIAKKIAETILLHQKI